MANRNCFGGGQARQYCKLRFSVYRRCNGARKPHSPEMPYSMITDFTLGRAAFQRLDTLASFTEEPGRLTRRCLSAAYSEAIGAVGGWMRQAGMRAHVDAVGTVIGRYEGSAPEAAALLIESHIDTVVDAGCYDGTLGIVGGIVAVEVLNRQGRRYPFAIEVIAFGDEEGVRFPSAMPGSRALAGRADAAMLDATDAQGITVRDGLMTLHGGAPPLEAAARLASQCLGYIAVHIEQGPVPGAEGLALGVVSAINGASRFWLKVEGSAGHAGTMPMSPRRDALAAAAEIVPVIAAEARVKANVAATVGQLQAAPGAVNVIPGTVNFTLDVRAPVDATRHAVTARILDKAAAIAAARHVQFSSQQFHDAPAVSCDPGMMASLKASLRGLGHPPRILASGSGHDAMNVPALCPIAMLFVRCAGGASHNPAESVTVPDVDAAIRVLLACLEDFSRLRTASTTGCG